MSWTGNCSQGTEMFKEYISMSSIWFMKCTSCMISDGNEMIVEGTPSISQQRSASFVECAATCLTKILDRDAVYGFLWFSSRGTARKHITLSQSYRHSVSLQLLTCFFNKFCGCCGLLLVNGQFHQPWSRNRAPGFNSFKVPFFQALFLLSTGWP